MELERRFTFYDKDDHDRIWDIVINLTYDDWVAKFRVSWSWHWCAGQIIDVLSNAITKYCAADTRDFWEEIKDLRENYHLNDMHAWTKKQEWYLKNNRLDHLSYEKQCQILDCANLLVDEWYKYWSWWLTYQIPLRDLKRIENLFTCKPPRFVVASRLYRFWK